MFLESVVGPRAVPVLNAMVSELERPEGTDESLKFLIHTFTHPSSTRFEADLLLSCTGLSWSSVGRHVRNADVVTGDSREVVNTRHTIATSIIEIRESIPGAFTLRSRPAFGDTLFGPRVANVLNGLLALEISAVDDYNTPEYFWALSAPLFEFPELRGRRRTFALTSEYGTVFAADALVLQHRLSKDELSTFLRLNKVDDFGLSQALFPAFEEAPPVGEVVTMEFDKLVNSALQNVRREMYRVHNVVHGKAVHILMARGTQSPLAAVEPEILLMIVKMVLNE